MDQVYMTLLIELTKAFLSIENAPNAHPRLKKALADALKPPPALVAEKIEPGGQKPITLKKDD